MIVISEEYWIKKGRENKLKKLFHKQIFQKAYGNISVLEMAFDKFILTVCIKS